MKQLLALVVLSFVLTGCLKTDTCPYWNAPVTSPEVEVNRLRDKIALAGITAEQAPEGYFFSITNAGNSGHNPEICSTVKFRFVGKFFNGAEFERSTSSGISVILGAVVVGLQKAMMRIKTNGVMTVYIPPSLGYGQNEVRDPETGQVIIPPDSDLIYEIDLISVD